MPASVVPFETGLPGLEPGACAVAVAQAKTMYKNPAERWNFMWNLPPVDPEGVAAGRPGDPDAIISEIGRIGCKSEMSSSLAPGVALMSLEGRKAATDKAGRGQPESGRRRPGAFPPNTIFRIWDRF